MIFASEFLSEIPILRNDKTGEVDDVQIEKMLFYNLNSYRSEHKIEIDDATKIIKIKPTLTSNKLEVMNELPYNFEKFKYAAKR